MYRLAPLLATVAGWWLGIQAVRTFFVIVVWNVAEDLPATQIALVGAAFWIVGLAGWIPARILGRERAAAALGLLVAFLSVSRQIAEHEGAIAILAIAALVAWLWWLPAWLETAGRSGAARTIVPGIVLGTAAQLAGQIALDGLDLYALPGLGTAAVVAIAGVLMVAGALRVRRDRIPTPDVGAGPGAAPALRGWGALALMPWLFLQSSLLVNLGRWETLTGYDVTTSGLLAGSGLLVGALLLVGWGRIQGVRPRIPGVAVMAAAAAILVAAGSSGGTAALLLVPAQALLAVLLHAAVDPAPDTGPPNTWLATYLGAILFFALLFALYYDPRDTLGASVWGLGALIVGLPAVAAARSGSVRMRERASLPTSQDGSGIASNSISSRAGAVLIALFLAAGALTGAIPSGPVRPSVAPAPARIALLDYNIHQGIARYGVPNLERTLEVIRSADADIVALQEVTRTWDLSGAVDTFAWLRAQLPGYHAVFGPTSVVRFGNAIFSRYPIRSSGFEWFPFGPSQDQRGFAWAQLETDAGLLLVITMHMTPYSRADEALERTAQAGILLDFWRSHGGGNVIFAGDFNSEKTDTAYAAMADAGLVDALAAAGSGGIPTFRSTGTLFGPASVEQLDYVFISPGTRVESGQVVDSDASDHYPLLVHLELGAG